MTSIIILLLFSTLLINVHVKYSFITALATLKPQAGITAGSNVPAVAPQPVRSLHNFVTVKGTRSQLLLLAFISCFAHPYCVNIFTKTYSLKPLTGF